MIPTNQGVLLTVEGSNILDISSKSHFLQGLLDYGVECMLVTTWWTSEKVDRDLDALPYATVT
jgi:hypothetical protein